MSRGSIGDGEGRGCGLLEWLTPLVVFALATACEGPVEPSPHADAGPARCASAQDCDDGLFCNGAERCEPAAASADALGCVAGDAPCGADRCDEAELRCDAGCERPDMDSDGHADIACGGDDCDDRDPDRFPGQPERCDASGHDEDCDPTTFGVDRDQDGHVALTCCQLDEHGALACGSDCDDTNPEISPESLEICNGRDDDCDGLLDGPDEDDDSDGLADFCAGAAARDCDDEDPAVYSGAPELCDGRDGDCSSGGGPEPLEDRDADGHAAPNAPCRGGPFPRDDCDDGRADVHPAALELCDGFVDEDCDGSVDEEPAASGSCELTSATGRCVEGSCELASCVDPGRDCNGVSADGCEIDTSVDDAHCGACGSACPTTGYCRGSLCRPHVRWARSLGGVDSDRVDSIAASAGEVDVGGTFRGSMRVGGGTLTAQPQDAFLATLSASDGSALRATTSGSNDAAARIHGLARGGDGLYGGGGFAGSADFGATPVSEPPGDATAGMLFAFDGAGAGRWSVALGGAGAQVVRDVALGPAGLGFVVSATSAVLVGAQEHTGVRFVLGVVDLTGAPIFSAGYPGPDDPRAVAPLPGGGLVMAGSFQGALGLGGDTGSIRGRDGVVAGFDAAGAVAWTYTVAGTETVTIDDVATDASGLTYAIGTFADLTASEGALFASRGREDFFLLAFDAAGELRWTFQGGSYASDRGAAIAVGPEGHVYAAATIGSPIRAGQGIVAGRGRGDVWVASLTAEGEFRWATAFGGIDDEEASAIAVGPAGDVYVAGSYGGSLVAGDVTLPSSGGLDGFVVALEP